MADQNVGLNEIVGNDAHDDVDRGNPVKIGGRVFTTAPTALADQRRTDATFSDRGGLLTAGLDAANVPQSISVDANGAQNMGGNLAHDAPDGSSLPMKIGGRAQSGTLDVVGNNNRVDAAYDTSGRQITSLQGIIGPIALDPIKREDDPHNSLDSGLHVLGVRRDADTSPVSADGDYHSLIFDSTGNLKVNQVPVKQIFVNEAAAVTWRNTGGTEALNLISIGAGAGRNGEIHDFETGARAFRFAWRFFTKLTGTPTVGETIDIYLKTGDGTNFDNDDGQTDVALSNVDKLRNLHFLGACVVDRAGVDPLVASGVVDIYASQASPVIFNNTADTMSSTGGDHGFDLVPVPMEIQ